MFLYRIGRFFRLIGILTIPGIVLLFVYSFILGNPIPRLAIPSSLSISEVCGFYAAISLVLCPASFAIYLCIRYSIYKKHWNDAYRKQLRGTHRRDRHLWDDTHWDKP